MQVRKIFVAGATGYLGHAVATRLKDLGHTVTVQGRKPDLCAALTEEGFKVVQANQSDKTAIMAACAGQDIVINCAGLSKAFANPKDYYAANVDFVNTLINGCVAAGKAEAPIKLIHIFSPSVYCNYANQQLVSEKTPLTDKAPNDYANSKLQADQLIFASQKKYNLPAIILRPHLVTGPGDKKILKGLIDAHNRGSLPLFNDGNALVDLTHIDNFVDAVVLALDVTPDITKENIYNISNGDPQKLRDLLQVLFNLIHTALKTKTIPIAFEYAGFAMSAVESLYKLSHHFGYNPDLFYTKYSLGLFANDFTLDISAARKELGYRPRFSTYDLLSSFAENYNKSHDINYKEKSDIPTVNQNTPQSSWKKAALITGGMAVAIGIRMFAQANRDEATETKSLLQSTTTV